MIEVIKGFIEKIKQMIVPLVEFDYEKALEEMEKNNGFKKDHPLFQLNKIRIFVF